MQSFGRGARFLQTATIRRTFEGGKSGAVKVLGKLGFTVQGRR
jgi:hypothetical protein